MYPRDVRVENPTEAMIVEQALAMYREMKQTADAAPDGEVLAQAESLALSRGREFTRRSLEAVVNEQAEAVEKKGRRPERVPAADGGTTGENANAKLSRRRAR